MAFTGFVFGVLMLLFGLFGSIFFDKLMECTHNRRISEREIYMFRGGLLLIFIVGLVLTVLTAETLLTTNY
ncbi:MAG: hypothetical protein FWH05_07130 [Oscillospiraceae bacterium]|nr:hypothetical protein [Oscillospiraceae bacterium]